MSPSKGKRRGVWLALRSLYYWPAQWLTHAARLASLPSDPWYRITAPWLPSAAKKSLQVDQKHRTPHWYQFRHQFTFADEHVVFDLDRAVQSADVKGIGLIFFMGMGDYFFATPLIGAIKKRFPHLPIIGFASKNGGDVNSPMLAELLRTNPLIDKVHIYDGRQTRRYKNYDFSDALKEIPDHYLAVPVLYEHREGTKHRLHSLFETFGLEKPETLPTPLLYLSPSPPPHVVNLFERIEGECRAQNLKGIVFLQLDSRSSHYTYPYTQELAEGLSQQRIFRTCGLQAHGSKRRDA